MSKVSDSSELTFFESNLKEISFNQSEVIHEWLFSEEIPNFNKNEYIKAMLANNEELETIFRLILAPFKIRLHPKAK